jgi:hypothetical protein
MTTLDLSATSRCAFGFPHSHIIICISHPSSHSRFTRASSEWSIAETDEARTPPVKLCGLFLPGK